MCCLVYLGGEQYVPIPDGQPDQETDVSLVTGKLRSTGINDVETGSALLPRDEALTVATSAQSAGT